MAGRRSRAALDAVRDDLQQSLSCVARSVVVRSDVAGPGRRSFQLSEGRTRLRGARPLDFFLVVDVHTPDLDQPDASPIAVAGYRFEIGPAGGPDALAFHWHPIGVSPVTWPHLHVRGGVAGLDLGKAHLPTGPVPLAAVLRFAITDLGVEPRRADWATILATP